MTTYITTDYSDQTIQYAAAELHHWLSQLSGSTPHPFTFHLRTAPDQPPFSWSISAEGDHITLTGHDSPTVLHAVYTLLERVGFVFEVDGVRWQPDASLENLRGWSQHIQPAVNWRGIRQHINFPMDISSYPLDEAREYIRNLARLRLNHITFHSYPDQWYEVPQPDGTIRTAGHYFYGQRHDLPNHPLRQVIRNQMTFCIPEHEADIDNEPVNSQNAIAWLQALIIESKRVGLRIQFSFELREQDMADSLATVDSILNTYPHIDVLEIITQESGEWGHAAPAAELRAIAAEYFEGVLDDESIASQLIDGQKDLDRLLREIGHGFRVMHKLRQTGRPLPQLAMGVYCTVRSDHQAIIRLLRRYTPPDVSYALLFDHGNRAVARNLSDLDLTAADWNRSMIYTWIEFDGTVYLLQNALEGIHRLLHLAVATCGNSPVNAISFNHWRTAENRTPARYAAQIMITGLITPAEFYAVYARTLGLAHPQQYAAAMQRLDDTDTQARDQLPNVGFCYVGSWGVQGLGYYGVFKPDRLQDVRQNYEQAVTWLTECARDTHDTHGAAYLAFIINRAQCTVTYLKALETAVEIQPICAGRTPDQLSDSDRQAVAVICDRALAQMEDYMALHARLLPDRGCEGTLISFYYTPPAVLKRVRAEFTGMGTVEDAAAVIDAPPSPIWTEA